MTFIDAVQTCFRKFITFSGRASRAEYWNFILFILIVSLVLVVVNTLIFGPTITESMEFSVQGGTGAESIDVYRQVSYSGGWLGNIFSLIVFLPLLAAIWRRLHDVGKPGWLALVPHGLLLVMGAVWYLTSAPVDLDVPVATENGQTVTETITFLVPQSYGLLFLFGGLATIAAIYVLIQTFRASDPDTNRFGPNPNEVPS